MTICEKNIKIAEKAIKENLVYLLDIHNYYKTVTYEIIDNKNLYKCVLIKLNLNFRNWEDIKYDIIPFVENLDTKLSLRPKISVIYRNSEKNNLQVKEPIIRLLDRELKDLLIYKFMIWVENKTLE